LQAICAQAGRHAVWNTWGNQHAALPNQDLFLTDTVGAPFDFWQKARGYVTLLFFGYTYRPDQCPLHMGNLGMALKKMPAGIGDQVKLVIVSSPGG
jgi:cytochrome oxidase Cu insertion factor (SCO1/SenC/PrrC family)